MSSAASGVAVLFADVSGSTRLYETAGDAVALATIDRCLSFVRTACEGHGGRVWAESTLGAGTTIQMQWPAGS